MPTATATSFIEKLEAARAASTVLATARADLKNDALHAIARAVVVGADRILSANELDLATGARMASPSACLIA